MRPDLPVQRLTSACQFFGQLVGRDGHALGVRTESCWHNAGERSQVVAERAGRGHATHPARPSAFARPESAAVTDPGDGLLGDADIPADGIHRGVVDDGRTDRVVPLGADPVDLALGDLEALVGVGGCT